MVPMTTKGPAFAGPSSSLLKRAVPLYGNIVSDPNGLNMPEPV
jgi:hypothetical protein